MQAKSRVFKGAKKDRVSELLELLRLGQVRALECDRFGT
jgi:hypothetical protein